MSARVLLVDDVELNRKLLAAQLRRDYYHVIPASSGPEALALANAEQPDVILLDVMMPGMDGFETCARLKAVQATRHIPVVFVTALDERVDRLRGLDLGADDFLTKPIDGAQLAARMRSLVRLKIVIDELRLREAAGRQIGAIDGDSWRDHGLGARILVVDDDPRRAASIEAALGRTHTVVNPDAGSAIAGGGRPDLVIVAAAAQRFDGLRVISGLRSSLESRAIPVLALCEPDDRTRALSALDLGAQDVLYVPVDEDELAARVRTMVKRKRYVDSMRSFLDRGLELAVTDQLTGLNNRRYLINQLQALVVRAARGGEPISIVMTDIDHFKSINDFYGHDAGDQVLRELAARLSTNLRPGDVPCRFGGEEFVILMPNTTEDFAAMAAERLRRDVACAPFLIRDGEMLEVTASFGVAGSAPGSFSVERLLKRADEALYRAKQEGRNRVAAAA